MLAGVLLAVVLQAPPSDSLTLSAALALAHARRGQIRAAAAGVAGARADLRVAGTIPNPSASYSHTESVPRDHASLDQSLDWLFRRGSDRRAAEAGVSGAEADSDRAVRAVNREVRSAFFGLLGARRVAALADDEARFADSLARMAARRFTAGDIAELESSQAALEAARVAQLASQAREDLEAARLELARAVGLAADSLPAVAGALDDGLTLTPAAGTVAELPMVRRAQSDSVAAAAAYNAVRIGRLPVPSLQVGLEWNDPTVLDQRSFGVIGVSVPIPIWQQGGGAVASAEARARESAALVQEARAEAASRRAGAVVRLTESRGRARLALDSILPLAVRQRELALRAYRAGETGLVPVLEALRAERGVAQDLVADLLQFQEAMAAWLELNEGS
ncbi:MAG TPA: TolC family protein [Gemmatimonadales bacterium]